MQLKSNATQVGILSLLHTAGTEAQDLYETFDYDVDEDKDDHELVLTKFRTYCEPHKTSCLNGTSFWNRNQSEGERVDQWVTDLCTKAAKYDFQTHESDMIRDKVVLGVQGTTNESWLVSIADSHTLHNSVRHMAETTSQSCVEVVDLGNLEGSLCIQSIVMPRADFSSVRCSLALDTGVDANVLTLDVYQQVLSDVPMTRTETILTALRNNKIRPEGEMKLEITCPGTSMTKLLSFYVTSAILGGKACTDMNLVKRVAIDSVSNTTVFEIYGVVFTGIGEYTKPYHIEVDSSVPPVIQHCRKVLYARYDNLKQTLSDLEEKGIVASVDKPTNWVHNLVITEKRDGRMRVCLDPKPLNKTIRRERHEIPTHQTYRVD